MKGIREIKDRIKAIKNTAQITRAMQLVAASKMKRSQDKAKMGRPYALLMAEILGSLLDNADSIEHPFFESRPVKKRGVLVISTDKGLCGPLNTNVARLINEKFDDSVGFVAIGRKGAQFLTRNDKELMAQFTVSDKCNFSEVRVAVEYMIEAYKSCKIDTLEVIFPRFLNTLVQEPVHEKLLPLDNMHEELEDLHKRLEIDKNDKPLLDSREAIIEPSADALLSELPDLFVKQEIFQMVLEAKASEHSARMVAMKSATDNAKELVNNLSLEYNKARQAAITQEILEIAAASASASQ
jgi:F-type H+-transporting ATPase subunit gamma